METSANSKNTPQEPRFKQPELAKEGSGNREIKGNVGAKGVDFRRRKRLTPYGKGVPNLKYMEPAITGARAREVSKKWEKTRSGSEAIFSDSQNGIVQGGGGQELTGTFPRASGCVL